jgi:hypothetical protein
VRGVPASHRRRARDVIPVAPTDEQGAYWAERDGCAQHVAVIGGPAEGPDVIPCPALVALGGDAAVVHVAFQLDEIEVAQLAQGGTLWLTTWGGLPVHLVEVVGGER